MKSFVLRAALLASLLLFASGISAVAESQTLPAVESSDYQRGGVASAGEGKLELDSTPSSRRKVTSIVIVVSVFALLAYFRLRKSGGWGAR